MLEFGPILRIVVIQTLMSSDSRNRLIRSTELSALFVSESVGEWVPLSSTALR